MLTSQQITEVKNIAIGFPFYRHNVILEKHFWNKINQLFRCIYDRSCEYKHSQSQESDYIYSVRSMITAFLFTNIILLKSKTFLNFSSSKLDLQL